MTQPDNDRVSLADAFKGTGGDAATSLAGLLPPKKSRPAPATTPAPRLTESDAAEAEAQQPAAAAAPAPAPVRVKVDPADNVIRNVPAYIDPDVLTAVRAARREGIPASEPDKTYDELLVEALERVSLDHIRAVFAPAAASTTGGLLQGRQRRQRGAGGLQIQLRMSKAQENELASLAEAAGAPSRSAFVTAAYRLAYLEK